MPTIHVDLAEIRELARKFRTADQNFEKDMEVYLDGLGNEFLVQVQNQILARNAVDTRLMLSSFSKGGPQNIYEQAGLTLEVGSNVYYAPYVEFGHSQQPGRFIPGSWSGGHFQYGAGSGGMVLKASFVPGRFFFAGALNSFRGIYMASWERKFAEWMARYFG